MDTSCTALSPYSGDSFSENDISDVEEVLRFNDIIENSYKMAGLSIEVDVPRSIIINYDENFNEREDYKLNELFQVLKFMKIKQNKNSKLLNSMDLLEVIRAGALYYENEGMRLVNVVKQMTAFNSIDHNDRLALVKYSGVEVIIFRSIQCYDDKQRHWRFPMVIRCNSLDICLHIVYTGK